MRYTAKRSVEALRQSWLSKNPLLLNAQGRMLYRAAVRGPKRFAKVIEHEMKLIPEKPDAA